jgi:hypothetical protein
VAELLSRSAHLGTVLICSHHVPTATQDEGERTIASNIEVLIDIVGIEEMHMVQRTFMEIGDNQYMNV